VTFYYCFAGHLLLSLSVKNLENPSAFGKVMGNRQNYSVKLATFFRTRCTVRKIIIESVVVLELLLPAAKHRNVRVALIIVALKLHTKVNGTKLGAPLRQPQIVVGGGCVRRADYFSPASIIIMRLLRLRVCVYNSLTSITHKHLC